MHYQVSFQDQAGESLFLLYRALKHQIEKGPCDAVLSDARYSLSEDRLLREHVNFETIVSYMPAIL